MYFRLPPAWAVPEAIVTPEHIYFNRRQFLKLAGFAGSGFAITREGIDSKVCYGNQKN